MQSLGGEIMYWNGDRVMGVLAVSRAIGDHNLRPFVIAQPEVQTPEQRLLHQLFSAPHIRRNCFDVARAASSSKCCRR